MMGDCLIQDNWFAASKDNCFVCIAGVALSRYLTYEMWIRTSRYMQCHMMMMREALKIVAVNME